MNKVTDPTPAPASPHRRFAPQLLPPRNCLQGRGVFAESPQQARRLLLPSLVGEGLGVGSLS